MKVPDALPRAVRQALALSTNAAGHPGRGDAGNDRLIRLTTAGCNRRT